MSSKQAGTPYVGELKDKRPRKSLSLKKKLDIVKYYEGAREPTSTPKHCSCPNPLSPMPSNKQQV
ncbi:hypothetical protein E2C01_055848 [Portunus trituberculatus]|uniref:Uncharacterized protein n=1 Tax=Portunus trituberculatus TaxID=210409 RepID=A0A5B7GSD4_PORTR|nr:hypothetical protein [Portunus trituberculatus]